MLSAISNTDVGLDQRGSMVRVAGRYSSNKHIREFIESCIDAISTDPSTIAASILASLAKVSELQQFDKHIKDAITNQEVRRRQGEYKQPNWRDAVSAIFHGPPANVDDLYAILVAHLQDLCAQIASANTDGYKRFWNEDSRGRPSTPKSEESCRDVLVDLLRARLAPMGVIVEPEGHMAADRRADVSVFFRRQKVVLELKRDYNVGVWKAAASQLDRFYTRDPGTGGYGIYGVFWFGERRPRGVPKAPKHREAPRTPIEMEGALRSMIPTESRQRLAVIVMDVSGLSLDGACGPVDAPGRRNGNPTGGVDGYEELL
jgi:hypothetical protein